MAKTVEAIPPHGKGGGVCRPYMDGQTWRLVRGEDFTCTVASLRASLSREARALGRQAHCGVRVEDGVEVVYLQAREVVPR